MHTSHSRTFAPAPEAPCSPSEALLFSPASVAGMARLSPMQRLWQIPQQLLLNGIGLSFCGVVLSAPATSSDGSDNVTLPVKVVAALAGLAIAVHAVWYARRQWRRALPEDAVDVQVDGHPEGVDLNHLVAAALSVALLDLERSGAIQLVLSGDPSGTLRAMGVDGGTTPWPQGTLEYGLWRDADLSVERLIHDWLADKSHFPKTRALRIIEDGAQQRGWPYGNPAAAAGSITPTALQAAAADACALLSDCQQNRPALWQALQQALEQGLSSREEPPRRYETIGEFHKPVYDYPEQPVEALRPGAQAAAVAQLQAAEPDADVRPEPEGGPVPPSMQAATAAPPKVEGEVGSTLVVLFLGLGLPGWRLYAEPEGLWSHLALGAMVLLSLLVFGVAVRRRHAGYVANDITALETGPLDLPSSGRDARRSISVRNSLGSGLALGGLAVLASSFWGFWGWVLVALVQFALLAKFWDVCRPSAAALVRGVRQRVEDPAGAADAAGFKDEFRRGTAPTALINPSAASCAPITEPGPKSQRPLDFLRARDLPDPGPATAAVLSNWAARDDSLRHYPVWWSLAPGLSVAAPILWVVRYVSLIPVEGQTGGEIIARMGLWHLGCALLFLGGLALGGWGSWWVKHQAFQRWPLRQPRRLVLLRAFGAPSYEDLLNLVKPWFRLGDVAHLDGADSVGQREDALEALEAGGIDAILVKSEAEALARARAWSREPDEHWLFRRHVEQCTAKSWQPMVMHLLDGAHVVLMDLSGLGPSNKGCAWELGQLLDRVPLERVTLLADDSTDLDVLRSILARAEADIDAGSPNAGRAIPWQALQVGGLFRRGAGESHAQWLRRMDTRLDGEALSAWLYRRAAPIGTEDDRLPAPIHFPKVSLSVYGALALLAVLTLPR